MSADEDAVQAWLTDPSIPANFDPRRMLGFPRSAVLPPHVIKHVTAPAAEELGECRLLLLSSLVSG
jgi:hypothetical protein